MKTSIQELTPKKYYLVNRKRVVISNGVIIYDSFITESERQEFREFYIKKHYD